MAGRGAYWAHSFQDPTTRTRAAGAGEAEGDPCSRGAYCSGRRITTENGERTATPARTYGPFCPACRGLISSCLSELPAAYAKLEAETAQMHRRGAGVRSPFGPRLPFDPSYQELAARIGETLLSLEERVRSVAGLSALDTQLSRARDRAGAVKDAAGLLSRPEWFSVLLALPAEPMVRSVPARSEPDVITLADVDGKAAGEEILALHRQALLLLGEIVRQREFLDGVPCRRCESIALYRAEPPSDPVKEAMWSECRDCRDTMGRATFEAWAAMYSRWASSSGVACRRCRKGRHSECQWQACSCAACEHSAALCAA